MILTTILRFWPTFWRDRIFCLVASDSARREDHFQKKLSKTDLLFKFCKIGLKNTLFIFGRKMVVCCFVVCCLLQLCPILAYFFLNWSTHRAKKDASKEKIIRCTVWELLIPYIRYPDSADLLNLQRCNWPNF